MKSSRATPEIKENFDSGHVLMELARIKTSARLRLLPTFAFDSVGWLDFDPSTRSSFKSFAPDWSQGHCDSTHIIVSICS